MTTPRPPIDERYHEIFLRLVNTLQLDYTCMKATNAALELDNKHWKAKAEELAKELENASTATDAAAETTDKDNDLADRLEEALEENDKLKTALDGEVKRIERAAKARKVARDKLERKTEEYNELVQGLLEAREQLDKARDENTGESRRIEDAEAKLKAAREELAKTKDALAASEQRRGEIPALEKQLQQARAKEAESTKLIEELRAQITNAEAAPGSDSTVDVAGIRRHLENAKRTFDDAPDKSYRAITRAMNLLSKTGTDQNQGAA